MWRKNLRADLEETGDKKCLLFFFIYIYLFIVVFLYISFFFSVKRQHYNLTTEPRLHTHRHTT